MQAIAGLVAGGMGISIAPSAVVNLHLDGVVFCTVTRKESILEVEMALAWRKGNTSSVLRGFIEATREALLE